MKFDFFVADGSDTLLDSILPIKGTARLVKEGKECLLGMAFELRATPITIKQLSAEIEVAQQSQGVMTDEEVQTHVDHSIDNKDEVVKNLTEMLINHGQDMGSTDDNNEEESDEERFDDESDDDDESNNNYMV